ncbi:MAG: DUF2304 domain-containing protein [Candidatus Hydrogenedentes bacterium]|nr:DUF2304 domain-containing protein [Candidatus Hydrogenedentota bacterium]
MGEAPQFGIELSHRVALLTASLALLCLVLELVRRGYLKERYALLWLATSGVGLLLGCFPGLIVFISPILQVQYLTVLFILSFVFLLSIVLVFTVVISRLTERHRQLTQEVALLANRLKRLEKKSE